MVITQDAFNPAIYLATEGDRIVLGNMYTAEAWDVSNDVTVELGHFIPWSAAVDYEAKEKGFAAFAAAHFSA